MASETRNVKPQWYRVNADTNSLPLAPNERIVRAIQVLPGSHDAIKKMLETTVVGVDELQHGGVVITGLDEFYDVTEGSWIVLTTPGDFKILSNESFTTNFAWEPLKGDVDVPEDEVLYIDTGVNSSVPERVSVPRNVYEKLLAQQKAAEAATAEEDGEDEEDPDGRAEKA